MTSLLSLRSEADVVRRRFVPPFENGPFAMTTLTTDADGDIQLDSKGRLALYFAVGLTAGAVIALQIDIMRVFSVGNWSHFGSLVV